MHKSGSKPEGCRANERTESKQPVQATEEPVDAVSSCGHDASLEEEFASWIDQQDRPFPSHECLEDWSRARCDEMPQRTVLFFYSSAFRQFSQCSCTSVFSSPPRAECTCNSSHILTLTDHLCQLWLKKKLPSPFCVISPCPCYPSPPSD